MTIKTRGIYATLCNYSDIQNLKDSEEEKLKTLPDMNHLKHFSNFQLLCDVQAKNLDHFHTEALKLPDNFTPSQPFSEHHHFPYWSGFKNMWSVSIILNYLLLHKLTPRSPPNLKANKIWSSPIFFKLCIVISIVL